MLFVLEGIISAKADVENINSINNINNERIFFIVILYQNLKNKVYYNSFPNLFCILFISACVFFKSSSYVPLL